MRRGAPFVGCVLLSLVVLFSPGSAVPREGLVDDKVVHAVLFAALAVTGLLAGVRAVALLPALAAYAAASEVLQAVLPIRRDGDLRDLVADVVGVLLGAAVGLGLLRGLARRRARP